MKGAATGRGLLLELNKLSVYSSRGGVCAVNLRAFNASVLFQPRYQHLKEEREKYLTFPDIGCSHSPREFLRKVFKVIFMDDHGESGPKRCRERTVVH